MNKYDIIQYNINPQPVPSVFNEGYSQYETLSKLLYLVNQFIENMNLGSDEIETLKTGKLSLEYYLDDIKNKRKLSESGNFTGTWNGLSMQSSEVGLATDWNSAKGIFETVTARLNNADSEITENANEILNLITLVDYRNKQIKAMNNYYEKVANNTARKIVTLGTSMTYGQDTFSSDKRSANSDPTLDLSYARTLVEQAGKTYPEALQEYMNSIYGVDKVTISNRGVSGLRTNTALSIWTVNPNADLHFIELGTNDIDEDIETFTTNYIEIIRRVLNWNSAIVLLTPPKHALDGSILIESFRQAVRNIGSLYGIPVMDSNEFLRGYPTYDVHATGDSTHYNTKGYSIFGSRVASALIGLTDINNPYTLTGDRQIAVTNSEYGRFTNGTVQGQFQGESGVGELNNYGMKVSLASSNKYVMSFYTEEENMLLVPLVNLVSSGTALIKLDFAIDQPISTNNLVTKGNSKATVDTISSSYSFASSQNSTTFNTLTVSDIGTKIIRVVGSGWHTISIENNAGVGSVDFMGFAVYSYQDFKLSNPTPPTMTLTALIPAKVTINKSKCALNGKVMTVMCNFTVTSALVQYDSIFGITGGSYYVSDYIVDKTLNAQITDNDAGVIVCKANGVGGIGTGTYDIVCSFILN